MSADTTGQTEGCGPYSVLGMAFIGFLSFGSVAAAAVFVFLYTLGGIPVLIVMYGKIYRKYQNL